MKNVKVATPISVYLSQYYDLDNVDYVPLDLKKSKYFQI